MMTQNSSVEDIQQFPLSIMMICIKLCKGNIFSQEIEKVSVLDPKSLFFKSFWFFVVLQPWTGTCNVTKVITVETWEQWRVANWYIKMSIFVTPQYFSFFQEYWKWIWKETLRTKKCRLHLYNHVEITLQVLLLPSLDSVAERN